MDEFVSQNVWVVRVYFSGETCKTFMVNIYSQRIVAANQDINTHVKFLLVN